MNKPKDIKDIANSMRMLEKIKKDAFVEDATENLLKRAQNKINETTSASQLSRASGAGYLSAIMNPKNVCSMQTIDINNKMSNVYIQTYQPEEHRTGRRKKITIIKKKRNKDGSVESSR